MGQTRKRANTQAEVEKEGCYECGGPHFRKNQEICLKRWKDRLSQRADRPVNDSKDGRVSVSQPLSSPARPSFAAVTVRRQFVTVQEFNALAARTKALEQECQELRRCKCKCQQNHEQKSQVVVVAPSASPSVSPAAVPAPASVPVVSPPISQSVAAPATPAKPSSKRKVPKTPSSIKLTRQEKEEAKDVEANEQASVIRSVAADVQPAAPRRAKSVEELAEWFQDDQSKRLALFKNCLRHAYDASRQPQQASQLKSAFERVMKAVQAFLSAMPLRTVNRRAYFKAIDEHEAALLSYESLVAACLNDPVCIRAMNVAAAPKSVSAWLCESLLRCGRY
jgi:hypothetical protein